jgi:hypothetical protein
VTGIYGRDYDDDGNPVPDGLDLDGGQLLGELHAALTRYVILPSPEAADAVVLWIAATHGQEAWYCAPRLDITSPVKRCGKSRLLDIIEATCHAPLITVNISPAALVRSIGADPPTLLLDEADTVFGPKAADSNEDLRGIINAGHSRNRPYIRWDMLARKTEECRRDKRAAAESMTGVLLGAPSRRRGSQRGSRGHKKSPSARGEGLVTSRARRDSNPQPSDP